MVEFKITELKRLLKRDWIYILGIGLFFVISIGVGRYLPQISPDFSKLLEKYSMNFFSDMYTSLKDKPYFNWVMAIFLNNLGAAGMMILVGALFPLLPLVSLSLNGLIIGLLERTTFTKAGMNSVQFYFKLLPHGIFELTAIFIAVWLGIRFGLVPYRLLWNFFKTGEYKPVFKEFLKEAVYYAGLTLILLIIAALIESTPILIKG